MFDMNAVVENCAAGAPRAVPEVVEAAGYGGPERRRDQPAMAGWSLAAFDEIDYGILLLGDRDQVVYGNHAARSDFDSCHPLQLRGRELHARAANDAAALREALAAARHRGLRKLLTVGEGANRVSVAIVPLRHSMSGIEGQTTLVMLGKRRVCEILSVQGFARSHCLTAAETRVLLALYAGSAPGEAAAELGVSISTVRTQIASIRMKTGANSIGELVRQVAVLPPIVGTLRGAQMA